MTTVRELEEKVTKLNTLLDDALQNSSVEYKQNALNEFNDSELIQNANNLSVYIDPHTPTVALIKFVKNNLPVKIEALQNKARLVQIQLDADKKVEITPVTASIPPTVTVIEESKSEINLVERLNTKLKPYIDKTTSRTSEYSYGTIEWGLSFFGLSGDSKTDKLNALDKFIKRFASDEAPALNETERAILTSRTLGEAINPLLDDEYLAPRIKEILTSSPSNTNQPQ